MSMRLQIFLVEDRRNLLDEVESLLRAQPHLEVIGRSLSRENAVAKVTAQLPDLVLMDWESSLVGVDVLAVLMTLPNAPKVIVLSGHDHPHFHAAVKALGAVASLERQQAATQLLPWIERRGWARTQSALK